MHAPKTLLVDDDEVILALLRSTLQAAGYAVLTAVDPSKAVTVARSATPDQFTLDIGVPPDPMFNRDRFGVAEWLHHAGLAHEEPVLFITGHSTEEPQAHREPFQPASIFQKPLHLDLLKTPVAE